MIFILAISLFMSRPVAPVHTIHNQTISAPRARGGPVLPFGNQPRY